MNVLVAGGTGFLGTHLVRALIAEGDRVVVLTRRPMQGRDSGPRYVTWDGKSVDPILPEIRIADAVINLSGASIGAGRWTPSRKQIIVESRTVTTESLVEAMESSPSRPSVFLNASAVGYYGDCGEEEVPEGHASGKGFLAGLCLRWETAALRARQLGVRVVLPRTALVLSSGGGALGRMALPYRMYLGGPLGSGRQWFPWIHLHDAVASMLVALRSEHVDGPMNVVAPGTVRMDDFARALGASLGRPSVLRVPPGLLSVVLGEMAEMILVSQRIVPAVLLRNDYRFRFPTLESALQNIFSS